MTRSEDRGALLKGIASDRSVAANVSLPDRVRVGKWRARFIYNRKRHSPKTKMQLFPLAGSVRRRRNRRHDFQHWRGGQAGSACAAGVQPDLVGHHPDQMEPAAAGAGAERALRARVSQGAAAAGYRRRGGAVQAQPAGRRIRRRIRGIQAAGRGPRRRCGIWCRSSAACRLGRRKRSRGWSGICRGWRLPPR